MTTEIIDKLFLELAQFTQAESGREAELLACIRSIARAVGCNHTETAEGRSKLVRCVEELMFEETGEPCRGCGKPLFKRNARIADGCPCNSNRGINHGLVPVKACTCKECDPEETGSSRVRCTN